jgi:hypothetical protein
METTKPVVEQLLLYPELTSADEIVSQTSDGKGGIHCITYRCSADGNTRVLKKHLLTEEERHLGFRMTTVQSLSGAGSMQVKIQINNKENVVVREYFHESQQCQLKTLQNMGGGKVVFNF